MNPSSLFQFIIGFFLGVILFGAGVAGGAYFFLTTVVVNPSKPMFEEEKVSENKAEKPKPTATQTKAEAKPTPVEEKKETDNIPDGAYKAKVTWSTGLSLRAQPSKDAERVGGIDYNTEIIVLTTSNDNQWQKVRIPTSGVEGWVKAGNTAKIE